MEKLSRREITFLLCMFVLGCMILYLLNVSVTSFNDGQTSCQVKIDNFKKANPTIFFPEEKAFDIGGYLNGTNVNNQYP